MINSTGGLTSNTHTKIWVVILTFLWQWHHAYLQRAYTVAEVSIHLGTTSSFYLTQHKTGWVYTLLNTWWPLPLYLHLQIKTHLLGHLNILYICATALAACLATANTLVVCKTIKTIVHMRIIIPCQNSSHPKHLSGVFSLLIFQNFLPVILSLAQWWDTTRTITELILLSQNAL